MNFLYLHGFASSPDSRKARFFAEHVRAQGWQCLVPDLNVPCFENLSLAAQIALTQGLVEQLEAPVVLVGSSMGGLLAALLESRLDKIAAMILLAPGFGITRRWPQIIGAEGMAEWEKTGRRKFLHYGSGGQKELHYQFAIDLQTFQTENFQVKTPTVVFHGEDDQTVPLAHSLEFAQMNQATVQVVPLADGHELAESLEQIWHDSLEFLAKQQICPGTACDTDQI